MPELTREIKFDPAYDRRKDPKGNFGVHGVNMTWLLRGPDGAIQFVVFTSWYLPEVRKEQEARIGGSSLYKPLPAYLGYHSPKAMYEGQKPLTGECHVLGGTCYYEGSGLMAEKVFDLLVREGGEAVWKRMEVEYARRFAPEGSHAA